MARPATKAELAELNAPAGRPPTAAEAAELNAPEPSRLSRLASSINEKRTGILAEQPPPTGLQSAASGVVQGASLGFGDEIHAGLDTANEAINRGVKSFGRFLGNPEDQANIEGHYDQDSANAADDKQNGSLMDYYRQMRGNYRDENKAAQTANPKLYGTGKFAGMLAVPVPGGAATTVAGKIGRGAGVGSGFGALNALGESEADLTKGDVGGALKDTAKGGAYGAAGGALGGLASAALGGLASKFGGKAKDIRIEEDAKALAKLQASRVGAVRQKLQVDKRADERGLADSVNPNLPTAIRQRAADELASPEGKARALRSAQALQDQMPGYRGELEAAQNDLANAPADAAAAVGEKFGGNPIVRKGWPRLLHYGVPALGAYVGGHLAGPEGAAAGGALGLMAGRPGRALTNYVKTPEVQAQALRGLSMGSSGLGVAAAKTGAVAGAESGSPQASGLEQWLNSPPKPDDEREQDGADHFSRNNP